MESGVGPPTSSSHSRPVRSASRNFYYSASNSHSSPANFTGPVRRWQKRWVHVSSSLPSTLKQRKQSNVSNSSNAPILLCKWTPLSGVSDKISGDLPRRKFRYTPIVVLEEQKKLAAKRVEDKDKSGEAHQLAKKLAVDADDIYGMLDINQDFMGAEKEADKYSATHSSHRSYFSLD